MGWFDNLIGWFSPKTACEREAWRLQLQQLRGAGYDAADHGRLNANWQAYNESADLTDRVARDTIRARARDLERNSDLANEIILAFRRNVVGKGFTLQARTQSDELNSQVEALWRQWTKSRNCDVTGQQSLNQMLRMAVQRKKVDGGILFLKCYTKDGLLPFKLQALEVDELALSQSVPKYKDDRVVGGVEFNRYGKPTGYWVQQYSINGWQTTEPEFHPAKDVIFYYSKRRPSQLREVSDFAPTISRIRDANEFITAVSVKERIAACLAVFIRKTVPTTGFGRSGQTAAAPKTTYDGKTLTPGMTAACTLRTVPEISTSAPGFRTVSVFSAAASGPGIFAQPVTVTVSRRRMSREEAPTCNSKSPGSTMRRMSASYRESCGTGIENRTGRSSPGANSTLSNAWSCLTGVATELIRSRTYSCTTSLPARLPVFFTRTVTLRVSVSASSLETFSIPEYSNRV